MEQLDPDEQPNLVSPAVEVSVVIITYNHEGYIRQAIDSVLMQRTRFPFEILIGEDDSTDGTREICQEYAIRHPDRIRLFLRHERDKIYVNGTKTGRFNSRQTRAASRGRYIAFLEGDDFWIDEEKLQKQFEFMECNPGHAMCGARCLFVDKTGQAAPVVFPRPSYGLAVERRAVCRWECYIHASTFFTRRSAALARSALMESVLQGDMAWQIEHSRQVGSIAVLPMVASVYRSTGYGLWSSVNSETQLEIREKFYIALLEYAVSTGDAECATDAKRVLGFIRFKRKYRKHGTKLIYRFGYLVLYPDFSLRQLGQFVIARWARKLRII